MGSEGASERSERSNSGVIKGGADDVAACMVDDVDGPTTAPLFKDRASDARDADDASGVRREDFEARGDDVMGDDVTEPSGVTAASLRELNLRRLFEGVEGPGGVDGGVPGAGPGAAVVAL